MLTEELLVSRWKDPWCMPWNSSHMHVCCNKSFTVREGRCIMLNSLESNLYPKPEMSKPVQSVQDFWYCGEYCCWMPTVRFPSQQHESSPNAPVHHVQSGSFPVRPGLDDCLQHVHKCVEMLQSRSGLNLKSTDSVRQRHAHLQLRLSSELQRLLTYTRLSKNLSVGKS